MTTRSFARSRRSFGLSSVVIAVFTGATLAGGCQSNPEGEPVAEIQSALSNIDTFRSLVVTEQPILAGFTFKRVMQQLVGQSGVTRLTALELWRQLWDTQNPKPGLGLGANCDTHTQLDEDGNPQPVINDYPYVCRTAFEGREIDVDPFAKPGRNPAEYIPIGLFNRFDLAPENGAHCGEHRIVFARRSGITEATNRNLLIFEFNLRNPRPAEGLGGCREIVQFWANLSTIDSLSTRAATLERFYFGTDAHGPVVHINNLGLNSLGVGQIRTNSLLGFATTTPRVWMMREFQLSDACSTAAARCLKAVPVTVKTNPFGPLFSSAVSPPRQAQFQQAFIETEVARLAASTLGGIDFKVADTFNTAQSLLSGSTENNYVSQLGGSGSFHTAIQAKLTAIGSGLSPENIAARAQALSCAGCHRLNARPRLDDPSKPDPVLNPALGGGLIWPASLGFVHVAENLTDTTVGGVTKFRISPALKDVFLPARKRLMDEYLDNRRTAAGGPTDPIGGRRVH